MMSYRPAAKEAIIARAGLQTRSAVSRVHPVAHTFCQIACCVCACIMGEQLLSDEPSSLS